jgi:hypothetical protein
MLRVNGAYKVDIYNEDRLTQSSDFQSNFITSTGLSYPFSSPFADCFKYMSVGSGTGINTVNTTGLAVPYAAFTSLGSHVKSANGFTETVSGMRLYRAWLISGVTGSQYGGGLPINEIGVSPREYGSGASGTLFSRLVPASPLTVPSGDYSIITYRLDVGLPTGVKSFNGLMNDSLVNPVDNPVCRYWSELSGEYSVVHNGLQTIHEDGGTISAEDSSLFGNPMEPAQNSSTLISAYLSTDNQQFLFNWRQGGKIATGNFQPWRSTGYKLGTGLMQYNYSLSIEDRNALSNARRDSVNIPDSGDFTNHSSATVFQSDSSITTITPDSYTPTGRTRSITKLFSWPSTQGQFQDEFGNDRRIKSLVLAYGGGAGAKKPFVDMIFATSGGIQHYSVDTGNLNYNTGNNLTGDYVFIDPYNNLSMSFRHSWSSPCPDDVSGCPGYS